MSDEALQELAAAAGIAAEWDDVFGHRHTVAPPTLRAVLQSLGLPADTEAEARDSRAALLSAESNDLPPLITASLHEPVVLKTGAARYEILLEDGQRLEGMAEDIGGRCRLPRIDRPGYHRLRIGAREITLAVAPARCHGVEDAAPGRKLWGLAAQLYSLRRPGDGGIGDFGALQDLVRSAARHGADTVAISPVHAQFSADPDRFSPYSPSSRVVMNILHANPDSGGADAEEGRLEELALIDWPAATRARLRRLRRAFEAAQQNPAQMEALRQFRSTRPDVEAHARFEALHAHYFGADPHRWNWRDWNPEHRDPRGAAVGEFAEQHAAEVAFHAWAQWISEQGLAAAQQAACDAGMKIGLIADLAVGADAGGSQGWSRQDEILPRLSIGAPPDLLNRTGQNWGLAAFSPRGLRQHGFGAFIEMLQAVLRHAGGVRIDHAFGLARLWVVPEGAGSDQGAYLHFPTADLMRLIALESLRHKAVVIAEDLGTMPEGFQDILQNADVMGMRVLWFERDQQQRFTSPRHWPRRAAALTTTHDLPTVGGWWEGRDLDWRGKLNLLGNATLNQEQETRHHERGLLWNALRESGAAQGEQPPPHDTWPVVSGALKHIGSSGCDLAIVPLEDALALQEQPNLPATIDEHPNWRRRLPGTAATILNSAPVADRLRVLNEARQNA